jgi:DNA polymerase-3 subunit gamma/tau
MSNAASELNLARKCRPKHFSDVVGQDISVRILQNGLYLKKLFPLYIFSGQRGCGKTTTARIFASAVNCERLFDFQNDPKNHSVPCLKCESCITFQASHHPDFIEMDAASHTGVDNIRQLLDSAFHMPLSGKKKIYLIDEGHMLSRAAFNAFLKMLEEPPPSVLFILATTELHKIPDTVRSRAFHVLFNAVKPAVLVEHLQALSNQESIVIDRKALQLISSESEGSVRDAVNLLDQARLTGASVTHDALLKLLGKMREQSFFNLFSFICDKNTKRLLVFLKEISFENLVPRMVWDMLLHLCRALIWVHYGIDDIDGPFQSYKEELKKLSHKCSLSQAHNILNVLWASEELFLRTSQKHIFLETVLVKLSCGSKENVSVDLASNEDQKKSHPEEWTRFLDSIEEVRDQLLSSICKKAIFKGFDPETKSVKIGLTSYNVFFQDKLESSFEVLKKIISTLFPGYERLSVESLKQQEKEVKLVSLEESPAIKPQPVSQIPPRPIAQQPPKQATTPQQKWQFPKKKVSQVREKPSFDVSNTARWPKAALLRSYFPGKIEKVGQ